MSDLHFSGISRGIVFWGLVFLSFLSSLCYGISTESVEISRLRKNRHVLTVEWKTYRISDTEEISLYGAKERKFFTENWYWGEAGYGALTGKRAGYLEGGIFIGYQTRSDFPVEVDFRLFAGAGGGGAAPQGGGLIVHPTVGIGWDLNSMVSVFVEAGYMHFLNGNISSPSIGFNINMNYWNLYYDKGAEPLFNPQEAQHGGVK